MASYRSYSSIIPKIGQEIIVILMGWKIMSDPDEGENAFPQGVLLCISFMG